MTIRIGSRVTKRRADSAADAVAVLQRELTDVDARRDEAQAFVRTYAPEDQVAARGEVTGGRAPWARVHGGIDVRGDGSMAAYTGRVTRRPVTPGDGESPFTALLRALS